MKIWHRQTAKNILQKYRKKFKHKKKQQQRITLNRGLKSKYKSLLQLKKKFCHLANSMPSLRFVLQKILFLEHHAMTRKSKKMQKGKITFYPSCLTKVTYVSSILKFLNTENLVVQVSNTRFNIQSLHL